MPHDPTESKRREMLPDMPGEFVAAQYRGEQVWTAKELTAEFEVLGFQAPFVAVKRKSDGVRGSLKFTHSPRWYFEWLPDQGFSE